MDRRHENADEDVTSGPVTHGGEGDPLGEGVAEAGTNDGLAEDEDTPAGT